MNDDYFKLPRLYTSHSLQDKTVIPLETGQAHYLHNVLRRKQSDEVRLFNGKDGEWIGALDNLGKKSGDVHLVKQRKEQPTNQRQIHLIFAPIKKNRMDWLIEKAVELGVSDFHPVLTQNTEVRKINDARIQQQIFEAAEQCERFSIPSLHSLQKLENFLDSRDNEIPLLSCLERYDASPIQDIQKSENIAFLIGPEGGFTAEEKKIIAAKSVPVSLGETILRCETAAVKALALINP